MLQIIIRKTQGRHTIDICAGDMTAEDAVEEVTKFVEHAHDTNCRCYARQSVLHDISMVTLESRDHSHPPIISVVMISGDHKRMKAIMDKTESIPSH